jgi:hypothetical protein
MVSLQIVVEHYECGNGIGVEMPHQPTSYILTKDQMVQKLGGLRFGF